MAETLPMASFGSEPSSVAGNTTLEQDKATVLALWLAMGGEKSDLRRNPNHNQRIGGDHLEWRETSDNVSMWYGVTVEDARVTKLIWIKDGLTGTIPPEVR